MSKPFEHPERHTDERAAAVSAEVMQRPSSTVTRLTSNGQVVYAKRYVERTDEGVTDDINQARAAREAEVLRRLEASKLFGGELGLLKLVSSDAGSASLVTKEVAGRSLEEHLWDSVTGGDRNGFLKALETAGRWLERLQSLPIQPGDDERFGDRDPVDLVEYCRIRMQTLTGLGWPWPNHSVRDRLLRRVADLVAAAPESERRFVWSHCDYGPWNILWDGRTLTPLDFYSCRLDFALVDVTYFLHRLEMQRIYFPWRRLPVELWKETFLEGYGRPDADASPLYRALTIRHYLCRLLTYVRRPMNSVKQQLHNRWVRRSVRIHLERLIQDA